MSLYIPSSFFRALLFSFCIQIFLVCCTNAQPIDASGIVMKEKNKNDERSQVVLGAERTEQYFPLIKNKNIAVVANHSSMIGKVHLVDSLLSAGFDVLKVFTPEHGFRGEVDAGKTISDEMDPETALPIVSLYGANKKPSLEQLKGVELLIFDIQDVGVRFYTYISTLHYVMEAAAEKGIPVLVLDRPNPNGFYVDGPVLEKDHQSFVGMHPVPVVHGMTIAEYAKMINGEAWLKNGIQCDLRVVEMQNYDHNLKYQLEIKPSPNLPNMNAIYLYPSLCFFEGTVVSLGRGTAFPFQQIGHPSLKGYTHSFVPKPMQGASNPKLEGEECFGYFFNSDTLQFWIKKPELNISWLIEFYNAFEDKEDFFSNYFDLLAGNSSLRNSIKKNLTEKEIKESWQEDLQDFKIIRKKYLLYEDFE